MNKTNKLLIVKQIQNVRQKLNRLTKNHGNYQNKDVKNKVKWNLK